MPLMRDRSLPDVPVQYKALVDQSTLELMHAAETLMSLVEELGAESYECTGRQYSVTIHAHHSEDV